jgi:hypothetical protein
VGLAPKQLGRLDTERVGDALDVDQADVVLAETSTW